MQCKNDLIRAFTIVVRVNCNVSFCTTRIDDTRDDSSIKRFNVYGKLSP